LSHGATLKLLKRPSVSPAQRTQLHQFDVTSSVKWAIIRSIVGSLEMLGMEN
jgi:hypothetical protein